MALSSYHPFRPPFFLDFKEWKPKQARTYFEWFVAQIPARLEALRSVARERGIEPESLDLSPDSIVRLGRWMDSAVETRPKTEAEISRDRRLYPRDIHMFIDPWEFADLTESLITDWGIYFGETIRARSDRLVWDWLKRPRSAVYYQQPIIVGFSSLDMLNPIQITRVVSQKTVDGRSAVEEIAQAFDAWCRYI